MFNGSGVTIRRAIIIFLLTSVPGLAMETDQFTVPPQPLVDMSPEFVADTSSVLERVMKDVNATIDYHVRAEASTKMQYWKRHHRRKAEECRGDRYIAWAVGQKLGQIFPPCQVEDTFLAGKFERQPALFWPPLRDTIYGCTPMPYPVLFMFNMPTVNFYGIYVGADKIGHFFFEGYQYYREYHNELDYSGSEANALDVMVKFGINQEDGFFGRITDGIFSNADLAANYAGFKFYVNLGLPITIDGKTYPPILHVKDGHWEFNPDAGKDYLRPFVTDHWNEAFNPSVYYTAWLKNCVQEAVHHRGGKWVEFNKTDRQREVNRLNEMKCLWGQDDGHRGNNKTLITIVNSYFDAK